MGWEHKVHGSEWIIGCSIKGIYNVGLLCLDLLYQISLIFLRVYWTEGLLSYYCQNLMRELKTVTT